MPTLAYSKHDYAMIIVQDMTMTPLINTNVINNKLQTLQR